jgi:mannose-6-phosphate isomerase-like protein (cupin superfamily)
VSAPRPPLQGERVPKPWGHEVIWAHTERYVGKILHVRAGESLSLQYHRAKDETIRILGGAIDFEYGEADAPRQVVRLQAGDGWHIHPGLRHRMTALADTDILEVSTPELDDVVRLEDRYGRVK